MGRNMIKSVPSVQMADNVTNRMQDNIVAPLNKLLQNPIVQGRTLSGVTLASGSNVIPHGLGRTLQGWIVTDVNALISVYRSAALNAQNLTLTSSGTGTVSLYVF